jgi:hypothetical protein
MMSIILEARVIRRIICYIIGKDRRNWIGSDIIISGNAWKIENKHVYDIYPLLEMSPHQIQHALKYRPYMCLNQNTYILFVGQHTKERDIVFFEM